MNGNRKREGREEMKVNARVYEKIQEKEKVEEEEKVRRKFCRNCQIRI